MDWLKSFFRNAEFSGQGSLVRLLNPDDNYTRKTEFINATLIVKNKELFVKNDDFDPDQEQLEYISFPLANDSQLVHYVILDDDTKVDCAKWVNLNAEGSLNLYYGFEFESHATYTSFSNFVSKYIAIDEEGFQDPSHRLGNLKRAQQDLAVTTQYIASNISKPQLRPDEVPEEEKSALRELNFKKAVISNLKQLYPSESILYTSPADLYLLGPGLPAPLLTDRGIGFLIIRHPEFKISLDLVRDQQIVMRILIDTQFYIKVDADRRVVSWVENVSETERRSWKVDLLDDASSIEGLINIAKYESERKMLVSELKEEDQRWVKGEDDSSSVASREEIMMDIDLDEEKPDLGESDTEEIMDSASSWRGQNVYVSRKNKVAIYSSSERGLERLSMIPIQNTPSHMLLHKQDNNLLFLNSHASNIIYNLDLTRGQIVEEFKVKEVPILQLSATSKFAPLTDINEYLGLSHNSVFKIDPRTPKKVVQEFLYKSNPNLSCATTTEAGGIAVGSALGEIRLYKEIGKKSTTNFPGLGAPIRSIDTTKDGFWLVATTDTYLMVIQTRFDGELAYNKQLARKRKAPKILQLNPEDIAKYQVLSVKFTPAKFNLNQDSEEAAIITSTGKLVVIWNFFSVKAGKLDDYCLKLLDESVIKNEFKYGEENAVITHPKSVRMQASRWNIRNKN